MSAPLFLAAVFGLAASVAAGAQPNWRPWTPLQYQPVYQLCARGDTLWAAGAGGVKRSLDGIQWSGSSAGMGTDLVEALAHGTNRLLAGQGRNLYSSEDGGRHWTLRDSIPWGSFLRIIVRADTLYAYHSLYGAPPPEGALFSVDDGLTWKDTPADRILDPYPVAFRGDTFSFSGKALLRKSGTGWDTLPFLPEPIAQVSASNRALIVCGEDRICMASPDGRSDWSAVKVGYGPAVPGYMAVDSAFLAMQTDKAIYLSRNQGKDWELLAWNFFPPGEQRLNLADGWLYATDPGHTWAHRYDIGKAKWDSVPLPGISPMGAFAAGSGLVAFGGPDSGNALYLSSDQGTHFRKAGTVGMHPVDVSNMALARSRIYFVSGYQFGFSDDSGRTWGFSRTQELFDPTTLAILDSGVYFVRKGNGIYRATSECPCDRWEFVAHPISIPWQLCFAGSGRTLYFASPNSSWIGDDPSGPTDAAVPISRRLPTRTFTPSLPVRIWRQPDGDAGNWIDAKGALRIHLR